MAINILGLGVLISYLALITILGLWLSGKAESLEEFYVADRSLGPAVLALTIMATTLSTGSFVGNAGLGAAYGYALVWMGPLQALSVLIMYIYFADQIRDASEYLDAKTFPEMFSERFDSRSLALISGGIIVVLMVPYTASILKGGSLLAEQLLGIPYWVATVALGGFIALYVFRGGYEAVASTDFVQGIILVVGTIILIAATFISIGGPANLTERLLQQAPEMVQIPGPQGWTSLLGILGAFTIGLMGQPQILVRFMTGEKEKHKFSAIIATLVALLAGTGFVLLGIVAFAYYGTGGDQAMPRLINEIFPGPVGFLLLIAGIAAARSTVDSLAFMAAQAISNDITVNGLGLRISSEKIHTISRIIVVILIFVSVGFALRPPELLARLIAYAFSAFAGAFLSPIIGLLYWKSMTEWGCAAGMISGVATAIITTEFGTLWGIPPFFMGILVSGIVILLVSFPTGEGTDRLFDDSQSRYAYRGSTGDD
jgi:SSS family solute:Na+ symporter